MVIANNTGMRYLCYLVLIILFFSFSLVTSASAPIDYEVTEIRLHAELKNDGSVNVQEFITYNILPEYEGLIEQQINISRASEIMGIAVSVMLYENVEEPDSVTGTVKLEFTEEMTIDRSGVFTTETVLAGDEKYKVVRLNPPEGMEKITIAVSYTLVDAIYLYNDTALLQWYFVTRAKNDLAGNVNIEIVLPSYDYSENVYAFAHGSDRINVEFLDLGSIVMNTAEFDQGDFLEVYVLLPVAAVAEGRKVVDNYILADMLEFKEYLELQALNVELQIERRNRLVTNIGIGLLLSGLILGSFFYFNSLKKSSVRIEPVTDPSEKEIQKTIPEHPFTPAELSGLLEKSKIAFKDLIATLMDLVVKKNLILSVDATGESRNLRLALVEESNIGTLEPHEEYLVNWFLNDLGDGSSFLVSDLKSIIQMSSRKSKFYSKFDTWKRMVKNLADRWHNMQTSHDEVAMQYLFDQTQQKKWMLFKNFLSNYAKGESLLPLTELESYMVYAVSLGESEKLSSCLSSIYAKEDFENESLTLFKQENYELFSLWLESITQGDRKVVS